MASLTGLYYMHDPIRKLNGTLAKYLMMQNYQDI